MVVGRFDSCPGHWCTLGAPIGKGHTMYANIDEWNANFNRVSARIVDMVITGEDGTVVYERGYDLPTAGYFVGGRYPSLILEDVAEIHREKVAEFVNTTPAADYYGVWTDRETGKVYIDAVDHYREAEYALRIAAERNEIAVWDIANARELRLADLATTF